MSDITIQILERKVEVPITVAAVGPQGPQGPAGPPGGVPSGTGLLSVTNGVADPPKTLSQRIAEDAANLRTQLGLGAAALLAVGTTAGTVAAGNHTHTAGDVGADPAGTATSVLSGHLAASDPHPGYATDSELSAGLAAKADISHTHSLSQLTVSGATTGQQLRWNGSAWVPFTQLGYVYIPAAAFAPAATNGASPDKLETVTHKVNIDRYLLDAATSEQVWISFAMPEDWNLGAFKARLYWTADSGSGGVTWGIAGVATSNDDSLDVALGSEVLVSDTLLNAGDDHETDATAAITIGGSPAQRDLIHLRVRRVPSDGSDTLAVDAALLGVWIQYTRTEAPAAW